MANRPGGKLAARPLLFNWIVNCSGSMSANGKMNAVNTAIRASLPEMRRTASHHPCAAVHVRTIAFSHHAKWVDNFKYINRFEWTDLIPETLPLSNLTAEVVFLIDTSGSMSEEIDAIRKNCIAFANQITRRGADVRLGLVGFDVGGHSGRARGNYQIHDLSEYTIGIWPMNEPLRFKSNIQELRLGQFGGGGCYLADWSTIDIFPLVINLYSSSRQQTRRFLVIISDEIGSTEGVDEIVQILRAAGIVTFVIGVGARSGAHWQIAEHTGGQFQSIRTSSRKRGFSELLATVAENIGEASRASFSDGGLVSEANLGCALSMVASELDLKVMPPRAMPPVLVLITDGNNTDDVQSGLKELERRHWGKKAVRLAIGIGADTDVNLLKSFVRSAEIKPLKADNPDTLMRYVRWASTALLSSVSDPAPCNDMILPPPPQFIADRFDDDQRW